MHGPYRARVDVGLGAIIDMTAADVRDGDRIADRYYQSTGIGTLVGFRGAVNAASPWYGICVMTLAGGRWPVP